MFALLTRKGTPPFSAHAEASIHDFWAYLRGSFVATAEPVYYDNHAVYFYLYHWRYRDARGWHFYDTEPALLRDRRMHSPPARWFYGDANETMASTAAPGAP